MTHAGIVYESAGGTVKLTGNGTTCAPTFQLPGLCCGAHRLAETPNGAPLAWSCWGNVRRKKKIIIIPSQVQRALNLTLAPSMSLTWSWTAVVTHVGNDSTQLSDQHYATVKRLWLQERDESCDRASSLKWVRHGGDKSTSLKTLTPSSKSAAFPANKNTAWTYFLMLSFNK